jgi:hypothetical protein
MRLLLLVALALPVSSSVAASRQDKAPKIVTDPASGLNCQRTEPVPAVGKQKAEVTHLGKLPPGALSLTVMREVNGCTEATIVRYGYGAADEDHPSPEPTTRAPRR